MIVRKDKCRIYASIINEDLKKIIGTVEKAIVAEQHQESTKKLRKVLSNITRDAIRNFTTEESYMKAFKDPEYQYHKEEHQNFSVKALAYSKTILKSDSKTANEILEYLKNWLVKHFLESDKKSTEYCNKSELKQLH